MFADNTLTPREAVRMCALGLLASHDQTQTGQPLRYGQLAGDIRHFISRIAGPQIDLMGASVELLRHEGLVEAVDGVGMEDDAAIILTPSGHKELHYLLTARLRPGSDLSRLVVALKMRFLHLLDRTEKQAQFDLLIDGVEGELARLVDLRGSMGAEGALGQWLDHEISSLETRLDWLNQFSLSL
jgi:Putative AphA-like transcriptional regulator